MSRADLDRQASEFAPVPVAFRTDGWTPEKQVAFIEALAACGTVKEAAAKVGMSREGAYDLRARPDAAAFRQAWETAMDYNIHRLGEAAFDRCLNGVPVPIFHKGEQVGERRHFDERLTVFLLRARDPLRHTPISESAGITWHVTPELLAERLHEMLGRLLAVLSPRRRKRDS